MNILIITGLLIVILIALRFVYRIYPECPLKVGEQVNIYIDNRYNRTATISHNLSGVVVIYDKLNLPVHYRGRFYALGYTDDGHTLMFVGRKRLYFLARLAELIRKIAGTPEYQDPTIETNTEAGITEQEPAEKENEG